MFLTQTLICPECAELSLVYTAVASMKHMSICSSCTIVSPYGLLQKEYQKHPKYCIFSLLSLPVCRTRKTKIRISASQLYPKLRNMHKKGRFHDTPVQLVQNVHRFASSAIGRRVILLHTARKRKTWWKAQFRFYLRLSPQRTSNELRDPAERSINKQRSFCEPLMQRPECELLCLEHCTFAK